MSRLFFFPVFLGVLVLLAVAALPASPALAATITVNWQYDEFGTDPSHCSLREAVQAANTNAAFGGCAAGSLYSTAIDTIKVPPGDYGFSIGAIGEELNAGGDLDIIESGLIIDGSGPDVTFIGGPTGGAAFTGDRVFDVHLGAVEVTIQDVRVRNGGDFRVFPDFVGVNGSGILNAGKMELRNSIVRSNLALSFGGGIYNTASGTADLYDSTVGPENVTEFSHSGGSGGGAGIYNEGMMKVIRSKVFSNYALDGRGGGIYNLDQRLDIIDSTIGGINKFQGNQALNGGGIFNRFGTVTLEKMTTSYNTATENGGGILNFGGTTTLLNTTISNNEAFTAAGISTFPGGTTELNFTTVAFNHPLTGSPSPGTGGGVVSTGLTTVTNTIIFYNTNANCVGNVVSEGFNLTPPGAIPPACAGFDVLGEQHCTPPGIASLANSGFPLAQTHALYSTSCAIDKANSTKPNGECPPAATDQRGVPRPFDGDGIPGPVCDIGAYERIGRPCDPPCDGVDTAFFPVGGTTELFVSSGGGPASAENANSGSLPYGGIAAGVLLALTGGWLLRRRLSR